MFFPFLRFSFPSVLSFSFFLSYPHYVLPKTDRLTGHWPGIVAAARESTITCRPSGQHLSCFITGRSIDILNSVTLTSCGVTIQALGYIARRIAERLCLHLCCEANLHTYNVTNLQPKTRSRLREPSAFAMASNHDDNRSSAGATVHSEIR